MSIKKLLPVIILILTAVATITIKKCKSDSVVKKYETTQNVPPLSREISRIPPDANTHQTGLDRNPDRLFFTKHARCRMKCRHITQQEVKEILINGEINYNKIDLQAVRGPKYAVEGITHDGQHVRIIFAPNTQYISVVTVIDLEEDFQCTCD